jgi:hypothetical protein
MTRAGAFARVAREGGTQSGRARGWSPLLRRRLAKPRLSPLRHRPRKASNPPPGKQRLRLLPLCSRRCGSCRYAISAPRIKVYAVARCFPRHFKKRCRAVYSLPSACRSRSFVTRRFKFTRRKRKEIVIRHSDFVIPRGQSNDEASDDGTFKRLPPRAYFTGLRSWS